MSQFFFERTGNSASFGQPSIINNQFKVATTLLKYETLQAFFAIQ